MVARWLSPSPSTPCGYPAPHDAISGVTATSCPRWHRLPSRARHVRLRAAISLQLVEVKESRARIAAARLAERRKLECNLHDAAQQRLLELAFQLRAASVNGDVERLKKTVADGVEQAHAAVLELRALANSLHPSDPHRRRSGRRPPRRG